MSDSWAAGAGVLFLGLGGYVVYRQWRSTLGSKTSHSPAPSPFVPVSSMNSHPAHHLQILSGPELLQITNTQGLVEKIRTLFGLSPENFERDVRPLIHRYAEFVQLLPASESHHHAQPGGLLEHTLEVAVFALSMRQGYKLPVGASVETQIKLGPVWTFGILVGALLHDIGKPLADVVIDLYKDAASEPVRWNGMTGSMSELKAAAGFTHYCVDFPTTRDYEAHQRLAPTLMHILLPPSARMWLGSDPELLQSLMAYLEGISDKSIFKDLIGQADVLSTKENLSSGTRVRFSASRNPPLIERLMTALRALMQEGLIPMNRPGAAAFVDPDSEHVWFVAGRLADEVRELLNSRERRANGTAGVPADNTRLFDTWSEYGALLQPPAEFGKGSVWWAKIDMDGWTQVLTLLKFPLALIYPGALARPAVLQGMITPVSPTTSRQTGAAPEEAPSDQPQLAAISQVTLDVAANRFELSSYDTQGAALNDPAVSTNTISIGTNHVAILPANDLPEWMQTAGGHGAAEFVMQATPPLEAAAIEALKPANPMMAVAQRSSQSSPDPSPVIPSPQIAAIPVDEFLDEKESANAGLRIQRSTQLNQGAVQPHNAQKNPIKAFFKLPGATAEKANAQAFFVWLKTGLSLDPEVDDAALSFNRAESMVHFVEEGMAIVTPRIFKHYLQSNAFIGATGNSVDALRALQNEVQRGGFITRDKKTSFHYYQTQSTEGVAGTPLTCYVVPNPKAFVRPLPAINGLLVKLDEAPPRTKPKFVRKAST